MQTTPQLAPMAPNTILPLIREVGCLRERGHFAAAAELEERIRQPIVVAGRVLTCCSDAWHWQGDDIALFAGGTGWHALVFIGGPVSMRADGHGPTIAAALADAQTRYQAAIADTLLRMGGLLRTRERVISDQ